MTYGQDQRKLDTVNIYISKIGGVNYTTYLNHWFYDHNKNSNKWNPKEFNKQDSLVIFDTVYHFFKVYDKDNRLKFTGRNGGLEEELIGDVIYYYKNGTKKRNEYYNHKYSKDTCNCSYILNDATGPEGIWTYYRKDGSTRKKVEYYIKVYSCIPDKYARMKKVTIYNKHGKLLTVKIRRNRD